MVRLFLFLSMASFRHLQYIPPSKPSTQSPMSDSPTIRDHLPPHKQAQNYCIIFLPGTGNV